MSWCVTSTEVLVPYHVVMYTTRKGHLFQGRYYPKGRTGLAFRDDRQHLILIVRTRSGPGEDGSTEFAALDLGCGVGLAGHEADVVEREKATHEHLTKIIASVDAGVRGWARSEEFPSLLEQVRKEGERAVVDRQITQLLEDVGEDDGS